MADAKKNTDLVELNIPFDEKEVYKFVAVNGNAWKIKTGETVMVPACVKAAWGDAERQRISALKMISGIATE